MTASGPLIIGVWRSTFANRLTGARGLPISEERAARQAYHQYMGRLLFAPILLLLCVCACSCSRWSDERVQMAIPSALQGPLKAPDKVTFYTLCDVGGPQSFDDGLVDFKEAQALPKFDDRYRILGQRELEADQGQELIASFIEAVQGGEKKGVSCFIPHHAIRVVGGGKVVDILVCFKCYNFKVSPGGGYNNVRLAQGTGMEELWRGVVSKHGLRDISNERSP
jgi:hypothetical protein